MQTIRSFTNVIARLRDVNLRPTCQRIALAKMLFEGDDRHITAEMLHQETQKTNTRISLATIYNTLNQFSSAELLQILSGVILIQIQQTIIIFSLKKPMNLKTSKRVMWF